MTEESRLFTLSNAGQARNCTLMSVLYPPNLELIQFKIGKPQLQVGLVSPVSIAPCLHFFETLCILFFLPDRK
jgi:hypothetical protein